MNRRLPFSLTIRFLRVWQRNGKVYRKTWIIGFLPPLLEPLFFLLAFGLGMSGLIGSVRYGDQEMTYLSFVAPAILAISIMNHGFFENTYGSFVRMYYQKTFDAMMATPLTVEEIIAGEIVWGATKSLFATAVMLAILSLFGLVCYPAGLCILPLAFLGGLAFGSIGMIFTALVPHIELFNLPVFLFITPMFLFSGTFFPLTHLPEWARALAEALPLTHLCVLTRAAAYGRTGNGSLGWSLLYLCVMTIVLFPVALAGMRRRLIK